MKWFKSSCSNSFMKSLSHVGPSSQEKKAIASKLGGQPREASRILTFPLSKASPGAYSTYRNVILSLLYFSMHVMYHALCIGFLYDIVIGCMLVPFHMYSLL
jgi:hypothetical protein